MNKRVFLVGMPGCGKSTIGRILANEINYNFVDLDKYLEEKYNKSISEIFENGEEHFRDLECEVLKDCFTMNRTIISTGGGVIKRLENREFLKKENVVFIDRPIEEILKDLDKESRPLLRDRQEVIYNLYKERYELYKEVSNINISNDGFIRDTINNIKARLKY